MKKLTTALALLTTFVTLPLSAIAKIPTTTISFDSSSYCGSYDGDMSERNFTLTLQANQKLVIATYEAYVNSVEDSEGNELEDVGGEMIWVYDIKKSGKYTVSTFGSASDAVEFCAL